jgi:Flp pilus assembly CpaE family ATPase
MTGCWQLVSGAQIAKICAVSPDAPPHQLVAQNGGSRARLRLPLATHSDHRQARMLTIVGAAGVCGTVPG